MSCKEKPASKNKHYTLIERKVFLQILDKYKNILEIKRSNATTLKDKDVAWSEICEEYNQSSLICQERTVQQLKKLWANLKQSQRDALTKEKQARLATGGGPPEPQASVDPDILNVAPHLMETAPVLFTSNMSEKEIEDKCELTVDIICNNENIVTLDNKLTNDDNNAKMIDSQDHEFDIYFNKNKIDETNKEHLNDNDVTIVELQDTLLKKCNKEISNIANVQGKKRKLQKLLDTEDNLRAQRIQQIINQEQDLATVKIRHEENMNKMREDHLKRLNEMEILHKTEMNKLKIEINKTKLKISQNQYSNKENINLQS